MPEITVHLFQRRSLRVLTAISHSCGLLALIALHFYMATSMLEPGSHSLSEALMFLCLTALLCGFFVYICMELQRYLSRCRVSAQGVTLLRPLLRPRLLPWDALQQVCICYRDGMRGEKPVILCFVEKGETKTIFGRWRTGNALHHHHLIAPDYSKELHEVVAACCPMEIADLRPTPDYAQ